MTELDESSLYETVKFITRDEQENITLSSIFHKDGKCAIPAAAVYKVFLFKDSDNGSLKGVTSLSNTGNILHCLKFTAEKEEKQFQKLISGEIPHERIFCVMGEKKGTELIASSIKRKRQETRNYTLMHYEGNSKILLPPEGLTLVKCGVQHLDSLIPLQKGYEFDEVLLSPDDFEEAASRLTLRKALREQIIYSLFAKTSSGSFEKTAPVAKAGTNAMGLNWFQLGGIYTVPRYRGLGCASFLAQTLAKKITEAGKKTALFVKDANIAAQKAYAKAGFVKDKPFEIIYY